MADHLPLPSGRQLDTRRRRPGPISSGRRSNRSAHAQELKAELGTASAGIDDGERSDDIDPRLVFKLRAATRIGDGPFARLSFQVLGEGRGWTYAVLTTRESRELFSQILSEYQDVDARHAEWSRPQNLADAIDNFEGVELYGSTDRLDPEIRELTFEQPEIVDISLWPTTSEDDARSRVEEVVAALEVLVVNGSVEIVATDTRPTTSSIRILTDRAGLALVAEHVWVERIRPQLTARYSLRDILGAQTPQQLPPPTLEPIGVIDGLAVELNPLLDGRILDAREFPDSHVFAQIDDHGTAVSSIAIWGTLEFVLTRTTAPDSAPIVNARILELRASDNKLVVVGTPYQTVESAIKWMAEENDVKIINVSFNRGHAETAILRSDLTETIDRLARKYDLVVVVAAGNIEPGDGIDHSRYPDVLTNPESEVAPPGDCALAVTVGAYSARDAPATKPTSVMRPIARRGYPAPFTRIGPVQSHLRTGRPKPEFSFDGGNLVRDLSRGRILWEDAGVAVPVALPPIAGQILTTESGTSFAAPGVAHEISAIAARYQQATANTLRALAALSARRTESGRVGNLDLRRASVYGEPRADRVLESGGPCAIMTIEQEVATNAVTVHELPVPYEFAAGQSRRSLRIALAFDPPVLRSRREYLAGSMSVELVRGLSIEEVVEHYQQQPTIADAAASPRLVRRDLPGRRLRPQLSPGSTFLSGSTLIRQDYVDQPWDPDLDSYFIIVSHVRSSWSARQQREYQTQRYSLAVELSDQGRPTLDVHNLVAARLQELSRIRGRIRV